MNPIRNEELFVGYEKDDYETHRTHFKNKEASNKSFAQAKDKLAHVESLISLCILALRQGTSAVEEHVLATLSNYVSPELKQTLMELENI